MSGAKSEKSKKKSMLSRDEIVNASIALSRKQGISKLTIRDVADSLGTSPMSLYYHIPDKDSLVVFTMDAILGAIKYPKLRAQSSWKTQFLAIYNAAQTAVEDFRDWDQLLYDHPLTPNGVRLINAYLSVLEKAGFTPNEAVRAYGVIYSHFLGRSRLMAPRMGVTSKTHIPGMDADSEKLRHRLYQLGTAEQQRYAIKTILDALDLQLQSKLIKKLATQGTAKRAINS